ncbi:hypothetical protein JXI42_10470, partial [bacterium]|nr:hypothetical protein [bacterium]
IEEIVSRIIEIMALGKNSDALEQQIDIMIYKIYGMTYPEVKVIDPGFPLSQEEYQEFEYLKYE